MKGKDKNEDNDIKLSTKHSIKLARERERENLLKEMNLIIGEKMRRAE